MRVGKLVFLRLMLANFRDCYFLNHSTLSRLIRKRKPSQYGGGIDLNYLLVFLFIIIVPGGSLRADDCREAQKVFDEASRASMGSNSQIKLLERALQQCPDDQTHAYNYALGLYHAGSYLKAKNLLARTNLSNDERSSARNKYRLLAAQIQLKLGELEGASRLLGEILTDKNYGTTAKIGLFNIAVHQGQLERAKEVLTQLNGVLKPAEVSALKIQLLLAQKDLVVAEETCREIDKAQNWSEFSKIVIESLSIQCAKAAIISKKRELAKSFIDRGLSYSSSSVELKLLNISMLYEKSRSQACDKLASLRKSRNEDPLILANYAVCLAASGQSELLGVLVATIESSADKFSDSVVINAKICQSLVLGDYDAARTFLDEAMKLDDRFVWTTYNRYVLAKYDGQGNNSQDGIKSAEDLARELMMSGSLLGSYLD